MSNPTTIEPFESGFLHHPAQTPVNGLVLTHGAGSNCNGKLLVAVAGAFASAGMLVYRYDLPFRRNRASGPPFPAAAKGDREGIRAAIASMRRMIGGRIVAGGHSYGGRQTTMAAAEDPTLADGLLLLSYPLHPPNKPAALRTAHFPNLQIHSLFVHGTKDGFGTPLEMEEALKQIPAATDLFLVEGAGHDLGRHPDRLADEIVRRWTWPA